MIDRYDCRREVEESVDYEILCGRYSREDMDEVVELITDVLCSMGWYYVTLAVDGKIRAHMETGLNYDIAQGKVSEIPSQKPYYTAGALNEAEIDYVFNHVGFSSTSTLYSLSVSGDALERAEKALAEREKEQWKALPLLSCRAADCPATSRDGVCRKGR